MNERLTPSTPRARGGDAAFDLDVLLHPASAFLHPDHVVADPDLTLNEKRAILASWASDACAVEAAPALRQNPGGRAVPFDEIMEALSTLDRQHAAAADAGHHRGAKRWRGLLRRDRNGRDGSPTV